MLQQTVVETEADYVKSSLKVKCPWHETYENSMIKTADLNNLIKKNQKNSFASFEYVIR